MTEHRRTVTACGWLARLLDKLATRLIGVSAHKAGVAALRLGVKLAIEDPGALDRELELMDLERREARAA